jgi:hypothetical protein
VTNRQEEALRLAEELLTDIELARNPTTKHVLKAKRLARLVGDDDAQVWLDFELGRGSDTPAGRRWMDATNRWTDRDAGEGNWGGSAWHEATRESTKAAMETLSGDISGEGLTQAVRYRSSQAVALARIIGNSSIVLAAVDAQVYAFATRVAHEIMFSELQASLFDATRETIDGRLTSAGDALKKIESINERLATGSPEAISQAMATCRRLIDATADELFPAREEPYMKGEQPLTVKHSNVLNRINAYVHQSGIVGGRGDRIRRALEGLYDRTSTAVHAEVDEHEARYLFLNTYILLGEILTISGHGSAAPATN